MSKNFALIGAAGYIAPRHMQAIKESGNNLVCALDKSDSVGVLDRYFTNVDFFTEFERFDRYVEMRRMRDTGEEIHYVSICSPNYFHDAHIRFALRVGSYAICEKPLVLNPWNVDALSELEKQGEKRIFNVLQLRVHPSIIALRQRIAAEKRNSKHEIDLSYITTRGRWYDYSWKGDAEKSGGVATNIGIHFFDMLGWIFGPVQNQKVFISEKRRAAGFIELQNARVRWYLSLEREDLPEEAVKENKPTFRSITVDGKEIEFSGGFADLHTIVYNDILNGGGYGIEDARPSIQLAYDIRHARPQKAANNEAHPLMAQRHL